jgi:osmotically-inducible protein OsmY
MRQGDATLTRRVRSEFIRRELDTTRLEVKVIHGVAYLGGELRGTRANKITDSKKEMEIIESIIYGISGIRGIDNRIKWMAL